MGEDTVSQHHSLADPPGLGDPANALRITPTQRRSKEKVERILDVTAELLDEIGVGAITMAVIARKADLPIGTLYHYFPNRLAVLQALAARSVDRIDAVIADLVSAVPPVGSWQEQVDYLVDTALEVFREEPGYISLVRAMGVTPELREILGQSSDRIAGMIREGPLLNIVRLPLNQLRVVTRILTEASQRITELALSTDDPDEAHQIIVELKCMMKRYVAPYIESD